MSTPDQYGRVASLFVTRRVWNSIRAHGEETYPNECCGAVLGSPSPQGWRVVEAVRAGNTRTDSARNRYNIAPVELVRIQRRAREAGLEIAGFYHSHPDHPAQWSQTDFAEAHWLGCAYVITAVAKGKATVTNSFLLNGANEEEKRFEQQKITIEDSQHSAVEEPAFQETNSIKDQR